MKIKITLKDPDGYSDCVNKTISAEIRAQFSESIDNEEIDDLIESRSKKIHEQLKQWFKYQEYLTVECDTDAGTCVVIQNK